MNEPRVSQPQENVPTQYSVPGMSCNHCVNAIATEVGQVHGVTSCAVDLETKLVSVVGGEADAIVAAIAEAGFEVA